MSDFHDQRNNLITDVDKAENDTNQLGKSKYIIKNT